MEGVDISSGDIRSFAELIWAWIVLHPIYAKLLVGGVVFFLFSLGMSKMIRAWRVK